MASSPNGDSSGIGYSRVNKVFYRGSDVGDFTTARIFYIAVAETLPVTGTASEVRLQDNIALIRKIKGPREKDLERQPSGPPWAQMTVG